MSDLISRQAAIDEAVAYIEEWNNAKSEYHKKEITRRFQNLPSAQPEIIRCKECKRQDTDNVFLSMWCYEMRTFVKPNDFCSRAERRTGA